MDNNDTVALEIDKFVKQIRGPKCYRCGKYETPKKQVPCEQYLWFTTYESKYWVFKLYRHKKVIWAKSSLCQNFEKFLEEILKDLKNGEHNK